MDDEFHLTTYRFFTLQLEHNISGKKYMMFCDKLRAYTCPGPRDAKCGNHSGYNRMSAQHYSGTLKQVKTDSFQIPSHTPHNLPISFDVTQILQLKQRCSITQQSIVQYQTQNHETGFDHRTKNLN
jgi:hypothetical protein